MKALQGVVLVPLAGYGLVMRGAEVFLPLVLLVVACPWVAWRVPPRHRFVARLAAFVGMLALAGAWTVTDVGGEPMRVSFHLGGLMLVLATIDLYARPHPARSARVIGYAALGLAFLTPLLRRHIGLSYLWRESWFGAWIGAHGLFASLVAAQGVCACGALAAATESLVPSSPRPNRARGMRAAAILVTVAAAVALAVGGALHPDAHPAELAQHLAEIGGGRVPSSNAAFADHAELGAVDRQRRSGEHDVALRAFSNVAPGYLRGKVYTDYEPRRWVVRRTTTVRRQPEGRRVAFVGGTQSRVVAYTVHPAPANAAHFFLPLSTAAVETGCDVVEVLPARVLRTLSQPTSRGYGVLIDPEPVHDEGDLDRYRGVPEDPVVVAAVDRLLVRAGLGPTTGAPPVLELEDAVSALARHIGTDYAYALDVEFPPEVDPVVHFLDVGRQGHCELFATVGAIALRRLGYGSRYVTGFVCAERNPYRKDLYLARNRHAHAWVEAYDPARGWRKVELTPGTGQPDVEPTGGWDAIADWARGVAQQVWDLLRDGPAGLPRRLISLAADLAYWLVTTPEALAAGLGVVVLLGLRRRRARRAAEVRAAPPRPRSWSVAVVEARAQFIAVEQRLARAGLGRNPSETLVEYAQRLDLVAPERIPAGLAREEATAATRAYEALRYAPDAERDRHDSSQSAH